MQAIKERLNGYKQKKETAKPKYQHRKQEVVFEFLKTYKIDYKTTWGKRLMGRMLRDFNTFELHRLNLEENLAFLHKEKKAIYESIMSTDDSRTRYVWSVLFPKVH